MPIALPAIIAVVSKAEGRVESVEHVEISEKPERGEQEAESRVHS